MVPSTDKHLQIEIIKPHIMLSFGYNDNGGHSHISDLGFGMRNQVGAN